MIIHKFNDFIQIWILGYSIRIKVQIVHQIWIFKCEIRIRILDLWDSKVCYFWIVNVRFVRFGYSMVLYFWIVKCRISALLKWIWMDIEYLYFWSELSDINKTIIFTEFGCWMIWNILDISLNFCQHFLKGIRYWIWISESHQIKYQIQ